MKKNHDLIVKKLKEEFEVRDKNYAQWIISISIKESVVTKTEGSCYEVRVLLLTSESFYLDGADLQISVYDEEAFPEIVISTEDPLLLGSPAIHAFQWIQSFGSIIYLESFPRFSL